MNTVIPGLGFHHIALRAKDFDRSLAFYRDVLGCTVAAAWGEAPSRKVMVDIGDGGRIEIFEKPGLTASWCEPCPSSQKKRSI